MANKKARTDPRTDPWGIIYKTIDFSEKWGKNAWSLIDYYKKSRQTSKLSLLKGLVIEFSGRPLKEILNVEPIDFQRKVKSKCVCGANLADKLYRLRIKESVRKNGLEHQVYAKIKSKKLLSNIEKKSKTEFIVGKECYSFLPEMLSEFGYSELKEISNIKKSRKKKKKALESLPDMPFEIKKEIENYGFDVKTIKKINELSKNSEFSIQKLLYELDPGKKKSFANWFKEGIRHGNIKNEGIIKLYQKLEEVPYLVSNKELAELATYYYEFRRFETDAVIGIEKDDLFYLSNLNDNDELIKKFGKFNINKHYTRPATKFRKREGLEKITIKEKLEQSHITFLEALGIKLHFPKLERIRKKANKMTSDKYGIKRSWNYILEEIKPIFEIEKSDLHEEYQKFGKIVKEHVL